MLTVILNVVFPVSLAVLVGLVWGRSKAVFDVSFITRLVTYVGAPCLIVSTIDDTNLVWTEFLDLAQWSVLILLGFVSLGWTVFKFLGMDFRSLSMPIIFPNTGNMGLPLSFFAFGEEGLAVALIIFVTVTLIHFGCGDIILGERKSLRDRLMSLGREPIFCATVIALILVLSGWKLPVAVAQGVKSLGAMTIPLMLITLGVSLSRIVNVDWRKGMLVSLLRVPGGLFVALLVVKGFSLDGVVAKVLILQAAMPAAVFNYFFALRHQKSVDTVASGVVLSTVLSFLILPFLLWYLMNME